MSNPLGAHASSVLPPPSAALTRVALGAHASSVLPLRSGALARAAPLLIFAFLLCNGLRIAYAQLPPPPLPVDPTPLPALLTDADKVMLQQARGPKKEVEA